MLYLYVVLETNYTLKLVGSGGTPDSVNPSVVDEYEGLPSPPLDEGLFFAAQPTSIELSQVCNLSHICSNSFGKVYIPLVYCLWH